MNKLAEFPLERAGLGDAPDHTVIVAWPAWSLTVGDVRAAVASQEDTTPQHSVTEQSSIATPEFFAMLMAHEKDPSLTSRLKLAEYIDARAQPLASTAASERLLSRQTLFTPEVLAAFVDPELPELSGDLSSHRPAAASEQQAGADERFYAELRKRMDALAKWNDVACRDALVAHVSAALTHRATTAAPVAWRDALRRAGYKDYHGLIAFTPAQLENFVSMLAAAPDIVTTAADQQGDTASELQLHRVVPALRQTKKGQ